MSKKSETNTVAPATQKQVEISASTMLGDLMSLVVDLAKAMPRTWQEMSEAEQDEYLAMIDKQCRSAVQQCVQSIASEGFVRIPVTIVQTTIKEDVKVSVQLIRNDQAIDLIGEKVGLLVLGNSEQFMSDDGKPKSDKDQGALGFGDEVSGD